MQYTQHPSRSAYRPCTVVPPGWSTQPLRCWHRAFDAGRQDGGGDEALAVFRGIGAGVPRRHLRKSLQSVIGSCLSAILVFRAYGRCAARKPSARTETSFLHPCSDSVEPSLHHDHSATLFHAQRGKGVAIRTTADRRALLTIDNLESATTALIYTQFASGAGRIDAVRRPAALAGAARAGGDKSERHCRHPRCFGPGHSTQL